MSFWIPLKFTKFDKFEMIAFCIGKLFQQNPSNKKGKKLHFREFSLFFGISKFHLHFCTKYFKMFHCAVLSDAYSISQHAL